MSNEARLLEEMRSEVADIARRIGVACNPQWVREELERVLNETKYKPPSKNQNQSAPTEVKTSGWIRGRNYVPSPNQGVPWDERI